MEETHYRKGEIIMEEGKPTKPSLQIINKGRVTIVSNKGEINNLQNGGHFGESTLQMKTGDPGPATITAIEDTITLMLSKKAIETVIGSTIRLGQARSRPASAAGDPAANGREISRGTDALDSLATGLPSLTRRVRRNLPRSRSSFRWCRQNIHADRPW